MKTYNNASNARRAAKAANLTGFTIIKDDTGYTIQVAAAPAPEPEPAPKAAKAPKAKTRKAKPAAKVSIAKKAPKVAARKAPAPSTRPGTKGAQLIAMCTRGATTSELTETLGWLHHTLRAAISRLGTAGYAVTRTKVGNADDGFESHYKIAS